jgi:hypothetical protein
MMKQFIVVLFLQLFTTICVQAQDTQKKLNAWTQTYHLTTIQQTKAKELLDLEEANLLELASIKTSDFKLYEQKQRNLALHTKQGLRSLLTTQQLLIFEEQEKARKVALREEYRRQKNAGADKTTLSNLAKEMEN